MSYVIFKTNQCLDGEVLFKANKPYSILNEDADVYYVSYEDEEYTTRCCIYPKNYTEFTVHEGELPKTKKSGKANETLNDSKEDRKLFVHNLGLLLSQTREGIKSCELGDNEIVTVTYRSGYEMKVNVNMDSYMAIISDVTNHIKEG